MNKKQLIRLYDWDANDGVLEWLGIYWGKGEILFDKPRQSLIIWIQRQTYKYSWGRASCDTDDTSRFNTKYWSDDCVRRENDLWISPDNKKL